MRDSWTEGWWVALTITFDEAVSKLSLNLTDIDKDTGEWIDHVIVTPNSFGHAFAIPTGTQPNNIPKPFVTGTGTEADPFRATGDYSLVLERNNGDVT